MTSDERSAVSLIGIAIAVVALAVAGIAVFVSNRDDGSSAAGGAAAGGGTQAPSVIDVTLTEYVISPSAITSATGTVTFTVTNGGTMVHNFAIRRSGAVVATTPDLNPGEQAQLVVELDEGSYETVCTIVGHDQLGMVGSLTASGSGGGSGEAAGGGSTGGGTTATTITNADHTSVDWEAMDAQMREVAVEYLDLTSKGEQGGRELEPTILADGTKLFELEAKIVDWQVEPGKIVKAWTYNGQVPGPTLHAKVGDKITIRLTNSLPESTSLHLHGIRVPNEFDGVDPYTQEAQPPGTIFEYSFTALENAVGMYHTHHDGQFQLPNGLAGAFIIGDYMAGPEYLAMYAELGMDPPTQEWIMTLNDAGTLGLTLNGKSFPSTMPYIAKLGETVLVHYFNEGLAAHPMHMHQPMGWVVAKDGHALKVPTPTDTVWIGPGERYTVAYKMVDPGVWAWHCHILTHAETTEGMRYMVTAVVVPNADGSMVFNKIDRDGSIVEYDLAKLLVTA